MRVAILGLGNMGKGIAQRLAGKADLYFGSRDAEAAADFAAGIGGNVTVTDYATAADHADIVVLALPYGAALEEARDNAALAGKILVDITNPLKPDFSGMTLGFETSAAEEIQKAAPSARVVKAYNTIFAALFAKSPAATATVPVFLSGSDQAAVEAVAELVELSGFAVERTGDLESARLVEPLGMLNIKLGFHLGKGDGIAPTWTVVAA